MYPQSLLSKNMKIVKIFQLKIAIFTAVKNRCMLHGRVFVMNCNCGSIFITKMCYGLIINVNRSSTLARILGLRINRKS